MSVEAVHVLIHLFEPDLFVAEHFADETRPLCQLMSPLLFTRRVWNDLGYSKLATLLGSSRVLGT